MVRALSPDSARIASDLIDQYYGADHITGTINNIRTQEGQNTLPAYGQTYAGWARTHHPADPSPYNAQDVRAFRESRPSASMPPALAGLPPRASGSSRPSGPSYTQATTSSSGQPGRASEIGRLASSFSASQLTAALIQQRNPQDFSGLPLPSGNSVPSQSFTSGSEPSFQYSSGSTGFQAQRPLAPGAFAASSSTGRPQHRAARQDARTAPYPAPSSLSSGSNTTTRTGRAPIVLKPTLPEHTALMGGLPQGLSRGYRSHINRFLCHLEQLGSSWSHLVPANSGVRPAALEQAVNAGIRDQGLHASTRAALNRAFGLVLQAESGRVALAPTLPEHTALMGGLPQGLSQSQRSNVSRFLCHLEQLGSSWSHLVPANSGVRPAALEQAVNAGIRDQGLHAGTRAALNRAFGYRLKS